MDFASGFALGVFLMVACDAIGKCLPYWLGKKKG